MGSRAAGAGCPACDTERKRRPRTVARERSLHALHPELVAEWHPTRNGELDPAQLSPASKRCAWWRCAACGHQWEAAVHNRARGSGCPVCGLERRARTRSQVEPARSLAIRHPEIAAELHPQRNPAIDPMQLGARSSLRLWWRCASCGHDWKTAVANRTAGGSGCPVCSLQRRARAQSQVEPVRSLAVKHPDIAAELHPHRNRGIDPTRLGARSSLRLWWRCASCGHEWQTAVSTRTDGSGCPACYKVKRGAA